MRLLLSSREPRSFWNMVPARRGLRGGGGGTWQGEAEGWQATLTLEAAEAAWRRRVGLPAACPASKPCLPHSSAAQLPVPRRLYSPHVAQRGGEIIGVEELGVLKPGAQYRLVARLAGGGVGCQAAQVSLAVLVVAGQRRGSSDAAQRCLAGRRPLPHVPAPPAAPAQWAGPQARWPLSQSTAAARLRGAGGGEGGGQLHVSMAWEAWSRASGAHTSPHYIARRQPHSPDWCLYTGK